MTTPVSGIGATAATAYTPPTTATGTSGTSGTTGTTGTTGTSATSTGKGSLLDPQAFLQLLVAQLKYQDPTNPTDTSTFMNQTAMLSQVQTMGSMSTTLAALAQSQQAQSATSMIGKDVTYLDSSGTRVSGTVGSVNLLTTGATLQVGDKTVPLANVVTVTAHPS